MDGNWSAVRVDEPVWRHEPAPAREGSLQVLEALATRIRYRRGQEIYKEDSPVEYWYRIVSGMARRFSARADGKGQIVDLLLPGDGFGFWREGAAPLRPLGSFFRCRRGAPFPLLHW